MSTKHETALRVAIAEKCGQGIVEADDGFWDYTYAEFGGTKQAIIGSLPNYPGDLNACHEMEKVLSPTQAIDYFGLLRGYFGEGIESVWIFHATAAQKCEAFVRACGLEARVAQLEKEL